MNTPVAQVARTYVAPGTVWDVARNRDHTTGAGALIPQDLGATTDRPGVWLQWVMLAGFPVAHGEVADEAAMLALHSFAMDSADNPTPRYVAPGDSCTRTDDPGWRWYCLSGHGLTLADWERRPLAGALADLATSGHTHTIAQVSGLSAALAEKQNALSNAAALARISAVAGGPPKWDGGDWPGGGTGGGVATSAQMITALRPVAWYRATAGTLRADGTTAGNGDAVATWQDQSGHGYHFSQASSGAQPLLVAAAHNGLPVVRFSGAQYLLAAGFPAVDLANFTIVFVGRQSTAVDNMRCLAIGASGAGNDYNSATKFAVQWGYKSGGVNGVLQCEGGTSTDIKVVLTAAESVSAWDCYGFRAYKRIGAATRADVITGSGDTVSATLTASDSGLLMGALYESGAITLRNSLGMQGDIGELVVFAHPLGDAALGQLIAALRLDWVVPTA